MYSFTQKHLQKILVSALLYFSISYGVIYAADHSDPNNPKGNNTVYIFIDNGTSITTAIKKVPSVSVKYTTQKINSGYCLYSMETIYNLSHLRAFHSFTVEKMKESEQSSITFLSNNSKEKETSVDVGDSDTLLISSIHNNPIIIQKKNAITGLMVEVAKFTLK